jgi:acetylornithine deacetylase/succinyl-diaminopimelate desuccinylase-like protein
MIFFYSFSGDKMKKVSMIAVLFILTSILLVYGKTESNSRLFETVQAYIQSHQHQIIKEFLDLLSIPNVSSDRKNVRENALFITTMMKKRGIKARLIDTAKNGNPVVFGEYAVEGATRTLMFYVHYDGQPVDPAKWIDSRPFEPVIRPGKLKANSVVPRPIPLPPSEKPFEKNWRIYARSTSDDKAPIISILAAMDALKQGNIPVKHNLKFIFEGEEEAGSTNLLRFLEKHKKMLKADVLFMCDGPAYFSGDPTLFFGVRGITSIKITVFGPNTDLHSGHFGNWAPNPALQLTRLLASMKSPDGRVIVQGFYDTVIPLTANEIKALGMVPNYDQYLKRLYGFCKPENPEKSLIEAIQNPSLNINGIEGGSRNNQMRTIIPSEASAYIDIRMVKGNDPKLMVQKVKDHIVKQGYHLVDETPDQKTRSLFPRIAKITHSERGYRAARTSMDLAISGSVIEALKKHHKGKVVLLPSLGGSLPLYMFSDTLKIPVIGVSIANHDNNQHQPNENIRIGHLWRGIKTFAALLTLK